MITKISRVAGLNAVSLLILYLGVAYLLPVRTACVEMYIGDFAGLMNEALVVLCAILAVTVPAKLAYDYITTNSNISEFLIFIFLSYAFVIIYFSLIYYTLGIIDTAASDQAATPTSFLDYMYFSTVTFTTLGYGDFRPCEHARLYAAAEAMLGGFFLPFSSAIVITSALRRSPMNGESEKNAD